MRNDYITKSKKGALAGTIADFWAYVAFVFIVMIFYAFFSYSGKSVEENKIISAQIRLSQGLNLINYLKTPYTLNEKQITMSDLISIYYNEKNKDKKDFYYAEILKKTRETFNPLEYCRFSEIVNSKLRVGYAVYILDKESYSDPIKLYQNYYDTEFRSEYFFDKNIEEQYLGVIPNMDSNDAIYVGFFVSSANFAGKADNAIDCT